MASIVPGSIYLHTDFLSDKMCFILYMVKLILYMTYFWGNKRNSLWVCLLFSSIARLVPCNKIGRPRGLRRLKPLRMLPDPFNWAALEKELSSLSFVDKETRFCFTVYVMVFCELRKSIQYLSRDSEVAVNDKLRKICKNLTNRLIKEGLIGQCPLVSSVINAR
jgi:hypothetical protein